MTDQHAIVEVPDVPADTGLPAWVQPTSIVAVLSIAVVALWKIVVKVLTEAREQNKALLDAQTKGLADLRLAVLESDKNNTLGLARVTDALSHASSRLDRLEAKVDEHGAALHSLDRRLTVVETK